MNGEAVWDFSGATAHHVLPYSLFGARTQLNSIFPYTKFPKCLRKQKIHKATAKHLPSGKKQDWGDQPLFGLCDLYVVPEALIYEIFGGIVYSEA